ncbi:MAG: C25 family cysteine peptidase [bacterium]|nr:C25 family cysteine peptidase [bacterium]
MMRKLWISGSVVVMLMAVTLSLAGSSSAATWVPLNGIQAQAEAPTLNLQRSDFSSMQLNVSLSGFSYESLQTKGGDFSRLLVGDEGYTTIVGSPQLPVIRRLIEIPYGASPELIIKNSVLRQDKLSSYGLQSRIVPVQPPVEKIPGALDAAPFVLDQAAYNRNAYQIGEMARLTETGSLRGHRFVMLEIYPVDYNPVTGDLRIINDIELEVRFNGSDIGLTMGQQQRYADPYTNDLADRIFINHGSFGNQDLIPPPLGMLIITNTHYAGMTVMQDFVNWKTQKGFHVTVATTTQTGTTKEQIKAYIQNAYDNWAIPPNFVLLIGDVDVIPNWPGTTTDNPANDLYYATLEGTDYIPDVGIGRLSPSNDVNFAGMINKTLNYEQCGWTVGDNWIKKAVFMASSDNYTVSEGTHNFVISNYMDPDGYQSTKLYCHTYSATTQQVTDNLNQGRSLAIYSGHGSTTSWADGPVFTQANVNALTNAVYPFVCSHSCLTGQFPLGECFGETWIRTANGTFAFWGSSVTSYWNEDDVLEKGMFEGFYNEQSPNEDQNLTWLSGMTNYAKAYLYTYYGGGGNTKRYYEMYNILGDPSVDLWTAPPRTLTVTYPSAILIGQNSLTVNVSNFPDWAMVNAYSSAEPTMQFTGYVNNSSVTFNLGSGFTLPGTLHVWVTGHDCRPFHGTAGIIPPSGPYVIFNDCDVNDAVMGNNNGQWDFSETVDLSVELKNVGIAQASSVNATIASTDPLVTILDNQAAYGNIGAGDSVRVANGFRVLSGVAPDQHNIAFNLTATSGSTTWNSAFSLLVNAPVVEFDRLSISDPAPGNNNGALDPGETTSFLITLINNGHSTAANTSVVLTSNNPQVTITGSPANYGTLNSNASAQRTYGVVASASIQSGTTIRFTMNVTANSEYITTQQFDLVCGDVRNMPTGPDSYGYKAWDNNDGGQGHPYAWVEVAPQHGGPGTVVSALNGDDQTAQVTIPFTFRHYGTNFTQISICTNGWLAMGSTTSTDYSPSQIPNSDGPPNMVALYWHDLHAGLGASQIATYNNTSQHYFVVEWDSMSHYSASGTRETFQAILYDPAYYPTTSGDGMVMVQYKVCTDPNNNVGYGIENSTQTMGINYGFGGTYDLHAWPVQAGRSITYVTPNTPASLDINISAVNPPVVIPANGGSFPYNISIHNLGTTPATFSVWNKVRNASNVYVQVFGPINRTLPGGANPSRVLTQTIAGSISSGTLYFISYIGTYPSTIVDSSFFTITKSTVSDGGPWIGASFVSGNVFDEFAPTITKAVTLPDAYSLGQNYPNPFNPLTTISFALPQSSQVTLTVFDLQGRSVAELVNGKREAGIHEVSFDASKLASGMYFYRIQAGDFTAIQKMVLLK